MNIITIDPSLSCTSVCVNGQFYVYATDNIAKTKTGDLSYWFEIMNEHIECRTYTPVNNSLSYSMLEFEKLKLYNHITDCIISDISLNLHDCLSETIVCIEGYSYSSVSGHLIDLVTFSTLLRSKLMLDVEAYLVVISPSTLKVKTCELTYGEKFNGKGKKTTCFNCDNISGGKFKKTEMLAALFDNKNLNNDWYVNVLRSNLDRLNKLSKVPKPIEDINDSKLMYEIILNIARKNNYNTLDIIKELV